MSDELAISVRNHIGQLTLNRPAALNALTLGMVRGLHGTLREWSADPDIYGVVLRGAGEKGFCAGGDIRALYESYQAGGTLHAQFFVEEYALDYAIHRYGKPCIALMDGIVMGGGMGIAQGAARRIVTERTRLAMPETGIGFFPDVGASYFLSRLPGALGMYLGITGIQIRAADALFCGLADGYLPHAGTALLDERLDRLAWTSDPRTDLLQAVDGLVQGAPADPPLARVRSAIDAHFGQPSVAAMFVALAGEARPAFTAWARETGTVMSGRSPTMMCVTREQLRRGASLSLEECFEMELGLARESFRHGDLIEGVRALLINKDGRPRWRPATVDAVRKEDVQRFFG